MSELRHQLPYGLDMDHTHVDSPRGNAVVPARPATARPTQSSICPRNRCRTLAGDVRPGRLRQRKAARSLDIGFHVEKQG